MDNLILESLKNHIDVNGKLKLYPSKYKMKIYSLFYLASKFEEGMVYSEKEVNEILDKWHLFNDRCILRRELYNNRFLGREKDCSKYWLEIPKPDICNFRLE